MSRDAGDGKTGRVDALVLAGTRGSRPFAIGPNGPRPKPLLSVGGQALVHRAVRAALGAKGIGRVYVVGETDALAEVLGDLRASCGQRLELVPEGANLVDNCMRSFFHHLLPGRGYAEAAGLELTPAAIAAFGARHPEARQTAVLVVASDLPFVDAGDIEQFLDQAPDDAALVAGLCDHAELEHMQQALGRQTVLDRWKLGAIPLKGVEVRWNNLWLSRPLMAEPVVYDLLDELYVQRWLLDQDGGILWRNWWANLRSLARYSKRIRGRLRFARGLFNALGIMLTAGLARWLRRVAGWLAWPWRQLLRPRDLEFVASLLLAVPIRVSISRNIAPAIDIDVEESYQALVADGQENYRRVARYLGRLEAGGAPPQGDCRGSKVSAGGDGRGA